MKISKILAIMGALFLVVIISVGVSMVSLQSAFNASDLVMSHQIEAKELGFRLKDSSDYVEDLSKIMFNMVNKGF